MGWIRVNNLLERFLKGSEMREINSKRRPTQLFTYSPYISFQRNCFSTSKGRKEEKELNFKIASKEHKRTFSIEFFILFTI